MEKIKCWVVYDDYYPAGIVHRDREEALETSRETREEGRKSYVRVTHFTKEELESFPEAD